MRTKKQLVTALLVFAGVVGLGLGEPARSEAAPREVVMQMVQAEAPAERLGAEEDGGQPHTVEAEAAPERVVRRIRGREMTVALAKKAREIINENYKKPFGTDIEFELDGQRYVGRIEQHYHPPGGELKPWGFHAGCSLFVVEG